MRISFKINSRVRKDGKQNIRIVVSDGKNVKPLYVQTPLNIFSKYWDKVESRVSKRK